MPVPKNSIPVSLQSLMADLDFLSQIQRNMKPCCNDRVLVDSESWTGAFYRFFKGESRLNVITKVEQIVHNAIEAIETQKYQEHLSLTINSLNNALNGILNLLYTYENDPNMKARLNVQIKNVNIQLDCYRHLIKGVVEKEKKKILDTEVLDGWPGVGSSNSGLTNVKVDNFEPVKYVEEPIVNLLDSSSLEFDKKKLKRNIKKKDS
tara:strand:+ start:667 stop:1287 length:621 start_codon:yes stop_codon:yes gene_type:complete